MDGWLEENRRSRFRDIDLTYKKKLITELNRTASAPIKISLSSTRKGHSVNWCGD